MPAGSLSSATAVNFFTTTTMQVLSRPAADGRRNAALELTTLHLTPAKLLAETQMLATVLAALFHTAALEHLQRHPITDEDQSGPGSPLGRRAPEVSPYPNLPLGPATLVDDDFIGIRTPFTLRRDGTPGRGTAIVTEQYVQEIRVDVSAARQGVVTEG